MEDKRPFQQLVENALVALSRLTLHGQFPCARLLAGVLSVLKKPHYVRQDFLPQQDPESYEQLVKQAKQFVQERFLPKLAGVKPQPVVHIIKVVLTTEPQSVLLRTVQHMLITRAKSTCKETPPYKQGLLLQGDMDSESIGNTICKKAESLPAVAVVMASQGKSRFPGVLPG